MPTNSDHICCAEVVQAGADIRALQQDIADNHAEALRWRREHEHREEGQYNMMMTQLIDLNTEMKELRRQLITRLPGWATLILTMAAATIGLLLGVIWELGRIVRGG